VRTVGTPRPQSGQPELRAVPGLRREPSAPQARGGEGGPAKGSWMTDLLDRASDDDARKPIARTASAAKPAGARPALQTIESLNTLSMDIARAIDHDVSVELWDRYQRGERNVFTRRLYTIQGQKTFDEIRTKYESDREFKAAVDRYVDDFEKLMDEVSRNDRDNMMTQTYLTSDTGKVYTMLAHAAGRLN
jgi:hypothetical protein